MADWTSPGNGTPDYYSEIRSVKEVPVHVSSAVKSRGNNGYIGIILYHNPSREYLPYSERLQVPLKEKLVIGQTYCVKLDIFLSQNAGYFVDRFDALFTHDPIKVKEAKFKSTDYSTVKFSKVLDNRDKWERLCSSYISNGTEKYLTIGNFQKNEEINKVVIRPGLKSSLDINESAYYLIDNVELIPVSSRMKCECDEVVIPSLKNQKVFKTFGEIEPTKLEIGDEIILNNVQFDFNQSVILESALEELNKVRNLLNDNSRIIIMISGHTDNSGSDKFNLDLSEKRARAVSGWLIMNGISSDRIESKGVGSSQPLVENSSGTNKGINRRVEFIILQK